MTVPRRIRQARAIWHGGVQLFHLYRYATVNMVELVHLLGAEKAAQAVRVFGEAFIRSMPTGKQNSFANRTLPDAVYVTLRRISL